MGKDKKKEKPKLPTRIIVRLMGSGDNEGKSLQEIAEASPGGSLVIRDKKKK